MAKYSITKAKINEKITTNTTQAITGNVLNEVLQTMVESLGADYQFGGLVQPGSTFTAGEQPVVFLATTPGTYTNFGGLVVADGEVALLVWSGTAWSKQTPDIATRTEVSQLGQEIDVFVCYTTASTAAKAVSATGFSYKRGGAIKIKFLAKNLATSGVTLNINSQGAKTLLYNGAEVTNLNSWENNETIELYYDDTYNDNEGAFIGRSIEFKEPTEFCGKNTSSGTAYNIVQLIGASLRAFNLLNLADGWLPGIVNSSGVVTPSAGTTYRYSKYIPIVTGHTYYWCGEGTSSVSIYAVYDSNKDLVRKEVGNGTMKTGSFVAEEGDAYVVITKTSTNEYSGWLIDVTENYFALNSAFNAFKEEVVKKSDLSFEVLSLNLADKTWIFDALINNQGAIIPSAGGAWQMVAVEVIPGKYYTFGGFYLGRSGFYAFYNGETKVESDSFTDPNGTDNPKTVQAPAGSNILYIDIKSNESPSNPYTYLQVNEGSSLASYDEYKKEIKAINGYEILGTGVEPVSPLTIIADLPVSDGTGIAVGYAYIDSATGQVKVKLS